MDSEFIKYLASLGVGGVMAAAMFTIYRKDIKQYTELWKLQSERIESLINLMMSIIKDNTASNTKLITLIETQERNTMRKSDVEALIEGINIRAKDV